jgi:hypothetical protein
VDVAVQSLRGRSARFGEQLVEQFGQHVGAGSTSKQLREIPLRSAQVGMIIMQDVRTQMGTLLVARGFEVTSVFLERMRNFGPELLNEAVRVQV